MDYILWEDVEIRSGARLTIAPGNTIKGNNNAQLTIGPFASPGELYAIGTVDSLITFTSFNDSVGGWDGLVFDNYSDNGTSSFLKNCIIEKGNEYNIYCQSTDQPTIDSCTLRQSTENGINLAAADITISNTTIENNPQYGIYLSSSSPGLINLNINNNLSHGLTLVNNSFPEYYNVSLSGNQTNEITVLTGSISGSGTWHNGGLDYILWEDVDIRSGARLTIAPGNTIKGNNNAQLTIGPFASPGELYAIGTVDSLITFTSFNDSVGGWDGLVFDNYSDNGTSSFLKNCIIEKGNEYNIYCQSTDQPTIDSCTLRQSTENGINLAAADITISNTTIENNPQYGIYLSSSSPGLINLNINNNLSHGLTLVNNSFPEYYNVSLSGNQTNEITVLTGSISGSGTWHNGGLDYILWEDVDIRSGARLTIAPGNTIKGNNNAQLTILDHSPVRENYTPLELWIV